MYEIRQSTIISGCVISFLWNNLPFYSFLVFLSSGSLPFSSSVHLDVAAPIQTTLQTTWYKDTVIRYISRNTFMQFLINVIHKNNANFPEKIFCLHILRTSKYLPNCTNLPGKRFPTFISAFVCWRILNIYNKTCEQNLTLSGKTSYKLY